MSLWYKPLLSNISSCGFHPCPSAFISSILPMCSIVVAEDVHCYLKHISSRAPLVYIYAKIIFSLSLSLSLSPGGLFCSHLPVLLKLFFPLFSLSLI